jgi:hypothetical protein
MKTLTLDHPDHRASTEALLQTEFIRAKQGRSEYAWMRIFLNVFGLVILGLLVWYGITMYRLWIGFVEKHVPAIVAVTTLIQGHRIIYRYSGLKWFCRIVGRQVFARK